MKNKSSESSDFSYGTTLNIWRCLSSPPSLHRFFSVLNILSFYKYFSFACQLPTWYVILLCTVYRWHVIRKHPFRVPSSPSYYIIIHIIYNPTDTVGGHTILWTELVLHQNLEVFHEWCPQTASTHSVQASLCLLTWKASLFTFITFCLRLSPSQQPLKVPLVSSYTYSTSINKDWLYTWYVSGGVQGVNCLVHLFDIPPNLNWPSHSRWFSLPLYFTHLPQTMP